MTYTVITLSGEVASGKSTIARQLLTRLPEWERFNTGQRFRDFCASKGKTIQQVSHIADEVHIEFDNYQAELMQNSKQLIVEGRMSGWLARNLPHAFRVYCYAPAEIRLERYSARHDVSQTLALEHIQYRDAGDIEKFRKIYGVDDYRDPKFYHLVLDTSGLQPEQLAKMIISEAKISPLLQTE